MTGLMRTLSVAVMLAVSPVAFAQEKVKLPPITAQMQPLGKSLDDIKQMIRVVMGPKANDTIQQMEKSLKDTLGDKGFTGIDLVRPFLGYAFTGEKADEITGVILVPITTEDEFKDFITRVSKDNPAKIVEVKGKKGLYAIEPAEENDEVKIRLRFHEKYAYIGMNVADEQLDPKALVPVAQLAVPSDRSLFSYRGYFDRYSDAFKKSNNETIEQAIEQFQQLPLPEEVQKTIIELFKMGRRLNEQLLTEGEIATYRMILEPTTGELSIESGVVPKKGTPLAKDVAARKPTTNQFAGLTTPDTTVGMMVQMPLFAPEIRKAVVLSLDEAHKQFAEMIPPPYQDLAKEAVAGVSRTVNGGTFDIASVLTGPGKDELYNLAIGVSFDDTAKLEKLLRKLHADAPEEIQNQIKLDAAKVGEIGIHRVPVGLFLPNEAKKIFGEKSAVCLAFAPKGIYLTFGSDSLAVMKSALAAKPGRANAFDLLANPARFSKLLAAANPNDTEAAEVLGKTDTLISIVNFSVEGGDELKVRFGLNLGVIIRAVSSLGANANATFQNVEPAKN